MLDVCLDVSGPDRDVPEAGVEPTDGHLGAETQGVVATRGGERFQPLHQGTPDAPPARVRRNRHTLGLRAALWVDAQAGGSEHLPFRIHRHDMTALRIPPVRLDLDRDALLSTEHPAAQLETDREAGVDRVDYEDTDGAHA